MQKEQSVRSLYPFRIAVDPETENLELKYQNKLKAFNLRLGEKTRFKNGQLVKWKPGLKNRSFPAYGEPAIVSRILTKSILDPTENSAASPYFQEPLTLVIGQIIDGDFVEYYVDGRRFEHFNA